MFGSCCIPALPLAASNLADFNVRDDGFSYLFFLYGCLVKMGAQKVLN